MKRRIVRRKVSNSSAQSELLSPNGRDPNCRLCPLWEHAETPCNWGYGSGKIMVILEAPTAAEDHVGAPLQGRPGQFLKEMLELTGIEDFYVTYAVKCLPSDRAPSAKELRTCKAYLEKEIEQVKPTHILTLGANALKTLMGRAKITEMHGQVLEYGDAVLVPTFHPGAVLRDPTRLPGFRSDILKFGNAVRG